MAELHIAREHLGSGEKVVVKLEQISSTTDGSRPLCKEAAAAQTCSDRSESADNPKHHAAIFPSDASPCVNGASRNAG
jgi:hypothetical protein